MVHLVSPEQKAAGEQWHPEHAHQGMNPRGKGLLYGVCALLASKPALHFHIYVGELQLKLGNLCGATLAVVFSIPRQALSIHFE